MHPPASLMDSSDDLHSLMFLGQVGTVLIGRPGLGRDVAQAVHTLTDREAQDAGPEELASLDRARNRVGAALEIVEAHCAAVRRLVTDAAAVDAETLRVATAEGTSDGG